MVSILQAKFACLCLDEIETAFAKNSAQMPAQTRFGFGLNQVSGLRHVFKTWNGVSELPSSLLCRRHVLLFPRQEVAIVRPMNLRVAIGKSIGSHPATVRCLPGILLPDDNDALRVGQRVDGPLVHDIVIVGNEAILSRARG